MAVKKRKPKVKKTFKVYCTTFPDNTYYIGFSTKMGKQYDNYYGSGKKVLEYKGEELEKETIREFDKKSHARMAEFCLQWQNRHDPLCLNDMINIRLRMSFLTEFEEPVDWKPKCHSKSQSYQLPLPFLTE